MVNSTVLRGQKIELEENKDFFLIVKFEKGEIKSKTVMPGFEVEQIHLSNMTKVSKMKNKREEKLHFSENYVDLS